MATPGVIQYADLARLRQRAISPDLQNPAFNRCRAQLHLAADLLRLGRRHEGLVMLKDLETRLLEWQKPAQSLCYLLWIGLLRAAAQDRQGAFYLAVQLVSHKTDHESDRMVAEFFQNLHSPAASLI